MEKSSNFTSQQLAIERVIKKVFTHYAIPLEITPVIRTTFKSKLWRMGKCFSTICGKMRSQQLAKWKNGKESVWNFNVNEVEINCQMLKRKRSVEALLEDESAKRKKLDSEVKQLQATTKRQAKIIAKLKTGSQVNSRGSSSKSWLEYSRQQQYNKKRKLASTIKCSLSYCEDEGFKPKTAEVENIDTGRHDILDITSGTFSKIDKPTATTSSVHSALYVKDEFSVSNESYHELSMISNLPNSSQVKRLTRTLNSQSEIVRAPNGVIGVQQSLRARLFLRIIKFIENSKEAEIPTNINVKLTGDGTEIARGLSVVNISFTLLEEGQRALSVLGNHSIAILKVSEQYDELVKGLENICEEARDLEVLKVGDTVFTITFYLGGDLKFLAVVCDLESATSECMLVFGANSRKICDGT